MLKYAIFAAMKKIPVILASLLALMGCAGQGEGYDVFLMIGQSNMAGRGTLLESDFDETFEGVFLLDSLDTPVPATHPFNQYSTIRKSLSMQQMNPACAFSKEIHSKTGRKVLLVVNAKGGTGLDSWMPGTLYFNEAVRRTREAEKHGTLKAILWHQGCTDGDKGKVDDYADRLCAMVTALRDSLGAPRIPFVAGEVARWNSYAGPLNAQIHSAVERLEPSACVSSEGCGMLRDESDPHFSREGQLLLGGRYAGKVLELVY